MTRIVILAAGKGKRMNSDLPKALVPLKGRPMIQYLLDSVFASGIDAQPIVVVSPDNQDLISQALSGYRLEYVVQEKQLGTGHAVAAAEIAIGYDAERVLVLYCDHPFFRSDTLKKIAAIETEALTIAPAKLPDFEGWHRNFYGWGRIMRSSDGAITGITELKDANDHEKAITEVNPGVMCFNRRWLFENIGHLNNDNAQQEYYLTALVNIAFQSGLPVQATNIAAMEAMGINSLEELGIAEDLLSKE